MKKLLILVLAAAMFLSSFGAALADVYVRAYYRRNGSYIAPHYRSNPDGCRWNNWSTYPNINPYTGKTGTKRAW